MNSSFSVYRKDFFMKKRSKNTSFILAGLFTLLIGVAFIYTVNNPSHISTTHPTPVIITDAPLQNPSIKYNGEKGQDALSLLKKENEVEMGGSGLVTSINSRKADDKKHEYWAFYINGKLASVGPAEYKTKDTDRIEWKIDKY